MEGKSEYMCEVKKSIANIMLEQCFDSLCSNGIYLECGTLVVTFDKPDCKKRADLSLVFVGGCVE